MDSTPNGTQKQHPRIKAVLFDAVGTLFRSRGTIGEIYCEVAKNHGVSTEAGAINTRFHSQIRTTGTPTDKPGWKALVAAVFEGVGPFEDFEAYFEDVYDVFRSGLGWRCYPETVPVLRRLHENGYRLGVVSNFDKRLHNVLGDLGIDRFLPLVVTPESPGFAKPDPRIFQTAARALEVDPSQVLFVGDDPLEDYQGAQRGGMQAVLVVRHGPPGGRPGRIRDLSGVLPILEVHNH